MFLPWQHICKTHIEEHDFWDVYETCNLGPLTDSIRSNSLTWSPPKKKTVHLLTPKVV